LTAQLPTVPTLKAAGAAIPRLGFGTWQLRGDECAAIVSAGLQLGYTHVDTAQGYANEEAVGAGLAESGIARERVFITTKVQPQLMDDGDLQRSVEGSLRKLGVSQIDLLLLHWPNPAIPLVNSIRALNEVKRDKRVRHIGLSNFPSALLAEALRLTNEPFAAEQLEYHPYLNQDVMLGTLRRHNIAAVAYCPLALGKIVGDPAIAAIATAHKRTVAQVTLRWLLQQDGVIAIPKSARVERLKENLAVFDFALTSAEMTTMSALARPGSRLVNEPQWVANWD
jgi:diketogulonate reductase-like aldo/keto reductase